MNILVACEESQTVCKCFRERGHNAFSCDLIKCSGGKPEWHIVADVLPLLNGNCSFETQNGDKHYITGRWDMIIAFPPCTYLTKSGACNLFNKDHSIKDYERFKRGIEAREFFFKIYNADCEKICIENPTPMKWLKLPQNYIVVQPYQFGHEFSKRTLLWLKGLPPLFNTLICLEHTQFLAKVWTSKKRSKTFLGIAKAMAFQWG